jgi:hypothetical protein
VIFDSRARIRRVLGGSERAYDGWMGLEGKSVKLLRKEYTTSTTYAVPPPSTARTAPVT